MNRITVGLALALIAGGPAWAGDKIDPKVQAKADVLFEQAQGFYQAGKYQAAIPLFQEAYELVHDPVYLYNVAQSYRRVLDCQGAFDYYGRYLDAATDAAPKQREKVRSWLRELQPCVEERERAAAAIKREQAAAQERQQVAAQPPPPPTVVDRGRGFRIAGLVTGGVGMVGLATGVGFAIRGARLERELADDCAAGCDWSDAAVLDKDRAGRRANALSLIGLIGGGVASVVGTGLYFYGRTKVEAVMIAPTEGGATVTAWLRF